MDAWSGWRLTRSRVQEAIEVRQRKGQGSLDLRVTFEHLPGLACSLSPSTLVLPAAGAAAAGAR